MISVPLIDELRETRRRLADECAGDLDRYAEMLRQVSERISGQYIRSPLRSPPFTTAATNSARLCAIQRPGAHSVQTTPGLLFLPGPAWELGNANMFSPAAGSDERTFEFRQPSG